MRPASTAGAHVVKSPSLAGSGDAPRVRTIAYGETGGEGLCYACATPMKGYPTGRWQTVTGQTTRFALGRRSVLFA